MVAHSKYSNGDEYENAVNSKLTTAWKRLFTKINRIVDENGYNSSQTIALTKDETFILPDITVFYDWDERVVEMRIEVKGFHQLPKKDSPIPELPLFPIKQRQLQEYWALSMREGISIRVVLVIGDKRNSKGFQYYWADLASMINFEKIKGLWDKEISYWFNVEEMSCEFSNF